MNNGALLSLRDVSIGYERRPVLQGINLDLRSGVFYGLIGPNGSGKTTMLKTMAGILKPLAGSIERDGGGGEPVIGYVPQGESLDSIFLFTSYEVALMGTCRRVGPGRFTSPAEKRFVLECLERTGAAELRKRRFSQLSGGQKQRVLIARALAAKPDFLILDEPTTGLDPAATAGILDLLRDLHEVQKLTILMVNHDLAFIRKSAREIIWLHDGKVLRGGVDELLSRQKIEELMEFELQ